MEIQLTVQTVELFALETAIRAEAGRQSEGTVAYGVFTRLHAKIRAAIEIERAKYLAK